MPGTDTSEGGAALKATAKGMENAHVRLRFDKAGRLSSVYDKTAGREVLAQGARGNALQLFDDRPPSSDAWDVEHNFEDIAWEPEPAESIEVV